MTSSEKHTTFSIHPFSNYSVNQLRRFVMPLLLKAIKITVSL